MFHLLATNQVYNDKENPQIFQMYIGASNIPLHNFNTSPHLLDHQGVDEHKQHIDG